MSFTDLLFVSTCFQSKKRLVQILPSSNSANRFKFLGLLELYRNETGTGSSVRCLHDLDDQIYRSPSKHDFSWVGLKVRAHFANSIGNSMKQLAMSCAKTMFLGVKPSYRISLSFAIFENLYFDKHLDFPTNLCKYDDHSATSKHQEDIGWLPLWFPSFCIPSGKRLHSYGKSPFSMGKSAISMAIFNSYFDISRW